MIEKIKKYKLSSGVTIDEYFNEKFKGDGKWEQKGNIIEFKGYISGYKCIYRWRIEGNSFYAVNGKAIGLTPELDKKALEISKRKEELSNLEREIYNFMESKWDELKDKDGLYDPEKHDLIVLIETSKRFNITKEEANKIYHEVERKIYGV